MTDSNQHSMWEDALPGTHSFLGQYVQRLERNGHPVQAQEIQKLLDYTGGLFEQLAIVEGNFHDAEKARIGLLEQLEAVQRERDAAEDRYDMEMASKMRVQERLESAQDALRANGHRPPGTPSFHMDGCGGCAALAPYPATERLGGWCEQHGGYTGRGCTICAGGEFSRKASAPAREPQSILDEIPEDVSMYVEGDSPASEPEDIEPLPHGSSPEYTKAWFEAQGVSNQERSRDE